MNSYTISLLLVATNAFVTFFTLTFETVTIRMHQLQSILKDQSPKKFVHFRKLYIKSIIHQSKSNKVFGNVFLVILIINLPGNCITCLVILFSKNNIFNILLYILIFSQFFLIGFLHIIAARSNTTQRKLCKEMMKMHVGHQDTVKRTIILNLFIQNYYTKKNYGFSYGPFGLISMMTFTQVCFCIIKQSNFSTSKFFFSLCCFMASFSCSSTKISRKCIDIITQHTIFLLILWHVRKTQKLRSTINT